MQQMTECHAFEEKLKYWEQLRNAIVHEDNLINNRSTWLLTFEGFLIAGFFAIYKDNLLNSAILAWIVLAIFLMASSLCVVTGYLLLVAYYQIASIREAWWRRYPIENYNVGGPLRMLSDTHTLSEFPPIIGEAWKFRQIMQMFKHQWLHMGRLLIIPGVLLGINLSIIVRIGEYLLK